MKFFLDLEFTPIGEDQECLTIGVVKVGSNGKVLDTFYRVIRTRKHIVAGYKRLHFNELKAAITFPQMCRELRPWMGMTGVIYCYGTLDAKMFEQDCQRYGIENILKGRLFDLQEVVKYDLRCQKSPSLEKIKEQLGSKQVRVLHHALVDAYDLMLVKQAIDQKTTIKSNPFYEDEAVKLKWDIIQFMNWSREIKYPPMVIKEEEVEIHKPAMDLDELKVEVLPLFDCIKLWTKKGACTFWGEACKEEQPRSLNPNEWFYEVYVTDFGKSTYHISYYREGLLVLKAEAVSRINKRRKNKLQLLGIGDFEINYPELSLEGQKIVESGVLGSQLCLLKQNIKNGLVQYQLGKMNSIWSYYLTNKELPEIDKQRLPSFKQAVGIIQSKYQYTPTGYLPVGFKVIELNAELDEVEWIQELSISGELSKEISLRLVAQLIKFLKRYSHYQWFAIEANRLKSWLDDAGGTGFRIIGLNSMERQMAISLNQTFLYEQKMLLRFAEALDFPLQSVELFDRELETFIYLIRYSKGYVANPETPMILPNSAPVYRPFHFTGLNGSKEERIDLMDLSVLKLKNRVEVALRRQGLHSVEQLKDLSDQELLSLRWIGPVALGQIKTALNR